MIPRGNVHAVGRVSSLDQRLPVKLDLLLESAERLQKWCEEEGVALLSSIHKGLRRECRCHIDRGHRFLHRPWQHRDVTEGMELPLIGERLLRPGAFDDVQ